MQCGQQAPEADPEEAAAGGEIGPLCLLGGENSTLILMQWPAEARNAVLARVSHQCARKPDVNSPGTYTFQIDLRLSVSSSWDALPPVQALEMGRRAHGYVTGVKDYGVFIAFCGGVKGLVPLAELGLEPNQDPSAQFPIGKVWPCCAHGASQIPKLIGLPA